MPPRDSAPKPSDFEFICTFKDSVQVKIIFECLKEFMGETSMHAGPDGLCIEGMDASHVALVQLNWYKAAFEFYQCDREMQLGLHFDSLLKILRLHEPDTPLSFCKKPNSNSLKLILGKWENNTFFDAKLMDLEFDALDITPAQNDRGSRVKVKAKTFESIVNTFAPFGESVRHVIKKDGFKWEVKNDTASAGRYAKETDDSNGHYRVEDFIENIDDEFNLKYFQTFAKACALTDEIILQNSAEDPLALTFALGHFDKGILTFYLAPKSTTDKMMQQQDADDDEIM